jgi:hypothetical protein
VGIAALGRSLKGGKESLGYRFRFLQLCLCEDVALEMMVRESVLKMIIMIREQDVTRLMVSTASGPFSHDDPRRCGSGSLVLVLVRLRFGAVVNQILYSTFLLRHRIPLQ